MNDYLIWDKQTTESLDPDAIAQQYEKGYVFVRTGKGNMVQTRSVRVALDQLTMTSENRRVLRKAEDNGVVLSSHPLPMDPEAYSYEIHKLGAIFYKDKFGVGVFSANTLRALIIAPERTHFTTILEFSIEGEAVGYCICYENEEILHYSYPFYQYEQYPWLGMTMMAKALEYSVEEGKKYFYLGSASKPADRYKLQFNNLQWFDGDTWQENLDVLKSLLTESAH